ncbi:MAG: hypothetical protein EOP53_15255 [Sphingobacteriales bacterium]|nr:MAG: hypothetical protein EOP53_15255 [Sphingobacteriales bacterium]
MQTPKNALKMKFYLVAFMFTLQFIICFSAFGQEIKPGKYGVYADVSMYTELTINGDSTFQYLNRGATGIPYTSEGKWKLKNGKLILYDYPENSWINGN